MLEVTDPRIEAIIEANTTLYPDENAEGVGPRRNQKVKLLKIMDILYTQTDPDHPMTTSQLVNALIEHDISSERRTLAKDIAALNEYGYEVMSVNVGRERGYYINKAEQSSADASAYDIPAANVVVQFEKGLLDVIQEKFGKDTPMIEIEKDVYLATVTVSYDPALWAWLIKNTAKGSFVLKSGKSH